MIDQQNFLDLKGTDNLKPEVKKFLNDARAQLKGCERRKFNLDYLQLKTFNIKEPHLSFL